jgi:hypothetical protein
VSDTLIQEDTDVDVSLSDGTDPNKCAHYIKKRVHADAYVFGQMVEALCGHRWVPSANPESKPICSPCKEIFEDDQAREQIGKYL